MLNLCDPRTIKQVMDMFGLKFKKEFGQNFLTDNMTVEDIADAANDDKDIFKDMQQKNRAAWLKIMYRRKD